MWPATAAEAAELESRAAAMLADTGDRSSRAPGTTAHDAPDASSGATNAEARSDPHLRTAEA